MVKKVTMDKIFRLWEKMVGKKKIKDSYHFGIGSPSKMTYGSNLSEFYSRGNGHIGNSNIKLVSTKSKQKPNLDQKVDEVFKQAAKLYKPKWTTRYKFKTIKKAPPASKPLTISWPADVSAGYAKIIGEPGLFYTSTSSDSIEIPQPGPLSTSSHDGKMHNLRQMFTMKLPTFNTRTQKASGINTLELLCNKIAEATGHTISTTTHIILPATLVAHENAVNVRKLLEYPVFARPCPVVPKHGFVDSRVITNQNALKKLAVTTLKEDPDADIAITKFLESGHSAIVSGGAITLGAGHDGATSAIGKSTVLPIVPVNYKNLGLQSIGTKWIKDEKEETLFWELVYPSGMNNPVLVQVRPGPNINFRSPDYIPEDVIVQHILTPSDVKGDLLEWATYVAENDILGTVINVPEASLASHFAIHGITHKVPVVTSTKVEKGDFFKANIDSDDTVDEEEVRQLFTKLASSKNAPIFTKDYRALAFAAIYGVHNISALLQEKDARKIAIIAAVMSKLGTMLALGELRYYKHSNLYDFGESRLDIYANSAKAPLSKAVEKLHELAHFYLDKNGWSGSYGGKPWYKISKCAVNIYSAFAQKKPLADIIDIMNEFIHLSHNSGKYLDKVLGGEVHLMDMAAEKPAIFTIFKGPAIAECMEKLGLVLDKITSPPELLDLDLLLPVDEAHFIKNGVPVIDVPIPEAEKGKVSYKSLQIRKRGTHVDCNYRFQMKFNINGCHHDYEKDLPQKSFTSQTFKFLDKEELATAFSHYGTKAMYMPLEPAPKSGWFGITINGKFRRVVSSAAALQLLKAQGHNV